MGHLGDKSCLAGLGSCSIQWIDWSDIPSVVEGMRRGARQCHTVKMAWLPFGTRGSQVQILSPRPIISSWIRFGIAWSGFGLRLAATTPHHRRTKPRSAQDLQFRSDVREALHHVGKLLHQGDQQCRLRVWPGTPLLPISSVRGFVRRKVATGRDLISLSGSIFPARAASERPARVLDSRTPR